MNLYNEIDPYCAQWLRNLIDAGEIPAGIVDERSIEDLDPDYVGRFVQCHFFAGLGGWPLALRLGGWPDTRRVWTGSCPCQPFSAAGKGGGFADERHLWPAFDWLIGQCRPDIVLGEQVEGPAGRQWLDLVATDVEGHGYAFGTAVFPAAGVGAPQIRHRTYWLASRLASADERQRGRISGCEGEPDGQARGWQQGDGCSSGDSEAGGVADAERQAGWGKLGSARGEAEKQSELRGEIFTAGPIGMRSTSRPGPVNGFWRASDWLYCRDDKWRPVEPGSFPLSSGAPARVGRLRAYGNAICVQQAQAFVESVTEVFLSKQLQESV